MKVHKFVDRVKIYVRAGDGGHGCTSFRREKYVPLGGPDGGDGGRGGNVVLQADSDSDSLLKLYYQPHQKAGSGIPGRGARMHGRNGEDLVVPVPCGTEVWDVETGRMVADLVKPGDSYLAVRGGKGGLGNVHFMTSTERAPKTHTDGTEGEERTFRLELKLAADAGLVGFPNAGKSSLLTAISHAHPRIAAYPFTTLNPVIGTVVYDDYISLKVADIPGLVENAHQGVGLGIDFLRHIERAGTLVHVIDMAATEGRDPVEDFRKIKNELGLYKADLLKRPFLVVANKMDEPAAIENLKRFKRRTRTKPIPLSCLTGEGIPAFLTALRALVEESRPKPTFDPRSSAS